MVKTTRSVWRKRAVVWHFVQVLLTTSYRTKSLGFLWALLDPVLFMLVYYLVFAVIIAHRKPWFMLHIYIGVISIRFLSASISQSAQMLKGQAGIIREIAFPKAVLPVAVVLTRFFDFAAGWVAAILIAAVFHIYPSWLWIAIPFLLLIQLCFVLGLSLLTAYIGVFFADIVNLIDVGMRLWFYMSPVLYLLTDIQEKAQTHPLLYSLYLFNPMTSILQNYELVVFRYSPALLEHFIYDPLYFLGRAVLQSVVMLLVGLYVFSRVEGQIGKYV